MYPFHFLIRTLKPVRDEAVLVCMYLNEFRPCRVYLKEGKGNFKFLVGVIRSFK